MNYEIDMRIDENALDAEWIDQPMLAMKYGKHYAECRRALTRAEEKIKIIRAELIDEANADPVGCCGKEKTNVADIEAYYRRHNRHIKAKEEWIDAQYECDMAEIAKNEVSFTRKAALEHLVQLHGQQYFAGPKFPRDLTEEIRKRRTGNEESTDKPMFRRNAKK